MMSAMPWFPLMEWTRALVHGCVEKKTTCARQAGKDANLPRDRIATVSRKKLLLQSKSIPPNVKTFGKLMRSAGRAAELHSAQVWFHEIVREQ